MNGRSAWLLRLASILLDHDDVARFVEPAIADLDYESLARRVRPREWLRVLFVVCLIAMRAKAVRAARLPWFAFAPVVLAVAAGIVTMRSADVPARVTALQWGWLGLGIAIAVLVATTGRRLLEAGAALWLMVGIAALLATAIWGLDVSGATRWLALGPIAVQSSAVAMPLVALGIARLFATGRATAALAVAALASSILAVLPDAAGSLVLTTSFAAAAVASRSGAAFIAVAVALLGGLAAAAFVREPAIAPVAHVEGIFSAGHFAAAKIVAVVALLAVPAHPLLCALRAAPLDRFVRVLGAQTAASLATSALLPLFWSCPVPLVGYGGSAVMGTLMSLAMIVAADAGRGKSGARGTLSRT